MAAATTLMTAAMTMSQWVRSRRRHTAPLAAEAAECRVWSAPEPWEWSFLASEAAGHALGSLFPQGKEWLGFWVAQEERGHSEYE